MLSIGNTYHLLTLYSSHSFIHSGYIYSAFSSPLLLRGAPDHSNDTVPEFHAEASQAIVSEGLSQGRYMAAGVGYEGYEPFGRKAPNLPMSNHAPQSSIV